LAHPDLLPDPFGSGGHHADPLRRTAVRFQLDRGDPIVAASSRAELVDTTAEPADAERWYGFSVYLPTAVWQKPDPSAEILAQWLPRRAADQRWEWQLQRRRPALIDERKNDHSVFQARQSPCLEDRYTIQSVRAR
jgi:hypothetical protein